MKTILFTLIFIFGAIQQGTSQKIKSELTFIYWMPYDNNLSIWSDSIYSMINSGLISEEIVVTVQKDISGDTGMTRTIISKKGVFNEQIEDDKSSSGIAYDQYLMWVWENVESKKYAMIFLDHGGKLDEIGLDEYPNNEFLRIDSVNIAIRKFNDLNKKKAELIFLQVCTKGSIEPIYEFKDASNYTMFSQTVLGAPNFYYESFFKEISSYADVSSIDGLKIAVLIAKSERIDMYQSLVCVDNSKFEKFIIEFESFISRYEQLTDYQIENNLMLFYYGQTYYDLMAFVQCYKGINSGKLLEAISDLVVMNKINPENNTMNAYCGLSLLAMQRNYLEQIKSYEHLIFFKSFKMSDLYLKSKKLLGK